MVEKVYTIIDPAGLHTHPSAALVNAATPFKSEVLLEYQDKQVNLKSIMGIMSLGIPNGATFKIIAKGDDSDQVFVSLHDVIEKEGLAR
ncbi:HPr family phosphocarrier protein [Neobacillus cucumis]|uniref:HPr family phosphocarrier protein n=1 Tax=Neobacillus cucumis TaxID=1740721 RepID=UPI002E207B3A|nr:HPr family phosphocarrier protein [Neobacillus cucumis]MED4228267.1 HPr family phosphocarrier protein [Neobacillus cucumis]